MMIAASSQSETVRTAEKRAIYVSIQILRAVAAVLVVVAHIILTFDNLPLFGRHLSWLLGVCGVYLFFIISGFLMVEISWNDFGRASSPVMFLRKRIVRVVPLYWLFTSIVVAGILFGHHQLRLSHALTSYLFLPYFNPDWTRPVLGVGWTLNYEMFFYVVFAPVLFWRRRTGLKLLAFLFVAILLVGTIHKSLFNTSDPADLIEFFTDPINFLFLAGCLISIAKAHWRWESGLSATGFMPIFASFATLGGAILGVLALVRSDTIYPLSFPQRLILWLAAGFLLAICTRKEFMPHDAVNRVLLLVGNASYSIYLSHSLTVRYVSRLVEALRYDRPLLFSSILLVMSLIVGIAIHLFVEAPMLKRLKSRKQSLAAIGISS